MNAPNLMTPLNLELVVKRLQRHELTHPAVIPLQTAGRSGARFFRFNDLDHGHCIIKFSNYTRDWVAQSTEDTQSREAVLATHLLGKAATAPWPIVNSGITDGAYFLIMRDISSSLVLRDDLQSDILGVFARDIRKLHHMPTIDLPTHAACAVSARLSLTRPHSSFLRNYSVEWADMIDDGWRYFFGNAPTTIRNAIYYLMSYPALLYDIFATRPPCLLHGDLKLDNLAIFEGRNTIFLDWSLWSIGPAELDVGWFIASNYDLIADLPDRFFDCYFDDEPRDELDRAVFESIAIVCGLLMRGWRWGYSAKNGRDEDFRWWCEKGTRALQVLSDNFRVLADVRRGN